MIALKASILLNIVSMFAMYFFCNVCATRQPTLRFEMIASESLHLILILLNIVSMFALFIFQILRDTTTLHIEMIGGESQCFNLISIVAQYCVNVYSVYFAIVLQHDNITFRNDSM